MLSPARILFPVLCLCASVPAAQRVELPVEADAGLLRIRELTQAAGEKSASVAVRLPDGRDLPIVLERFAKTRPGGSTSHGKVPGDPKGYAAFALQGDSLVGVVRTNGELFRVGGNTGSPLALRREDQRTLPGCATPEDTPPLVNEASGVTQPSRPLTPGPLRPTYSVQSPSSNGDTVVDLLVCWTAEAAAAAGGNDTITALIDLATLETNLAFDNSLVNLFLRVVHVEEVVYVESGDMAIDLNRLRAPADGFMDNVHTLRDTHGADAVSLFVANDNACGRSFNMGSPPSAAFAPFAFNLVSQGCATGYYAFGHELGHNFGLNHDRFNATGVPSYPYAYGYWTEDHLHRTIMALDRPLVFGTRIPYFANPDVSYEGMALGVAPPSTQASHCALALNNNAGIISAWRPSSTP